MPLKLKRIFEREYGKKKGDRIFYAWENKMKGAMKRSDVKLKKTRLA